MVGNIEVPFGKARRLHFRPQLALGQVPGKTKVIIEVGAGAFSCSLEESLSRKEGFGGMRYTKRKATNHMAHFDHTRWQIEGKKQDKRLSRLGGLARNQDSQAVGRQIIGKSFSKLTLS